MAIITTPELTSAELGAIERIEELHRQLRYAVAETRRWSGELRRNQVARATRASNAIEGYAVSEDDALAAVEGRRSDNDSQAQQAVECHARAMTYILQRARAEMLTHSPDLLLSLHFVMTEYDMAGAHPGQWRTEGVWVNDEATGDAVYEGPHHPEVPGRIDELMAGIDADDDHHAFVRAAMAHLNLVMIHPWKDGNGRMSRALQTSVLAARYADRLAPEFVSIEEWLGSTKANTVDYYRILQEVGGPLWRPETVDALPWVRFCLTAHYEQAQTVARRISEAAIRDEKLTALAAERGTPERSLAALTMAAQGRTVTNAAYRQWVDGDISTASASNDLKQLVADDLLKKHGDKKGTTYTAGTPVAAVEAEISAVRKPVKRGDLFG